jgi:hypothetical protein
MLAAIKKNAKVINSRLAKSDRAHHKFKVSHLGQEFQKLADEKTQLINRAYRFLWLAEKSHLTGKNYLIARSSTSTITNPP